MFSIDFLIKGILGLERNTNLTEHLGNQLCVLEDFAGLHDTDDGGLNNL